MSFRELIVCDAQRVLKTFGGARKIGSGAILRLLFLTPGFQLTLSIRLQEKLARIPVVGRFLRRVLWYVTTIYFGCDIDPEARFGPGLYLPHPLGIVIGGEWDIGCDVSILQGVTLGRVVAPKGRCRIGDRVQIGAGAKVLGDITIGDDARIGANAVVVKSVPAGSTAVGIPARIQIRRNGEGSN